MCSFGASTDLIDVQTTRSVPFDENRRRKRHSKRRNRSRNPQSHLVFLQFFSQPPSPLLTTPTSSLYRPLPFPPPLRPRAPLLQSTATIPIRGFSIHPLPIPPVLSPPFSRLTIQSSPPLQRKRKKASNPGRCSNLSHRILLNLRTKPFLHLLSNTTTHHLTLLLTIITISHLPTKLLLPMNP